MRCHLGRVITKYDICQIACEAYTKSMTPTNIMSSFRRTGIYPINKRNIPAEKLYPCEPFREKKPLQKVKAPKVGREEVYKFLQKKKKCNWKICLIPEFIKKAGSTH